MTTPKVETKTRYGDRWYVRPTDGREAPGVSSIVDMYPKQVLMFWAAKMAAEFAVDNIATIATLAKTDESAAIALIKGAPQRSSGKAADAGTMVHGYAEEVFRAMLRGERPKMAVPKEVMPFLRNLTKFINEFRVTPHLVETTVWHDEPGHEYAGTFDLYCHLGTLGQNAIVDLKTGASGVWSSAAIQQTGYRYASHYVDMATGELCPMPMVDATYALWLRDTGWALIPLESGPEELAQWRRQREAYTWKIEREKSVVGKPINAVPLKKKWTPRR